MENEELKLQQVSKLVSKHFAIQEQDSVYSTHIAGILQ